MPGALCLAHPAERTNRRNNLEHGRTHPAFTISDGPVLSLVRACHDGEHRRDGPSHLLAKLDHNSHLVPVDSHCGGPCDWNVRVGVHEVPLEVPTRRTSHSAGLVTSTERTAVTRRVLTLMGIVFPGWCA